MTAKSKHRLLSVAALELVAGRFRVLSEPMRLRLLATLQEGEKNVTALVAATGSTQANVSKHLGILAAAGMVGRRKDGLSVFYFISDPKIFQLCELMCSKLEEEFAEKSRYLR
jgi:DNA-binding transcriptional ArsR family regulator